jgi:hypothetical protein
MREAMRGPNPCLSFVAAIKNKRRREHDDAHHDHAHKGPMQHWAVTVDRHDLRLGATLGGC